MGRYSSLVGRRITEFYFPNMDTSNLPGRIYNNKVLSTTVGSLAPDCKPAPILAEHTVWEI